MQDTEFSLQSRSLNLSPPRGGNDERKSMTMPSIHGRNFLRPSRLEVSVLCTQKLSTLNRMFPLHQKEETTTEWRSWYVYVYLYIIHMHTNTYKHTCMHMNVFGLHSKPAHLVHCNTLQHTATHCITLHNAATRCNTHSYGLHPAFHATKMMITFITSERSLVSLVCNPRLLSSGGIEQVAILWVLNYFFEVIKPIIIIGVRSTCSNAAIKRSLVSLVCDLFAEIKLDLIYRCCTTKLYCHLLDSSAIFSYQIVCVICVFSWRSLQRARQRRLFVSHIVLHVRFISDRVHEVCLHDVISNGRDSGGYIGSQVAEVLSHIEFVMKYGVRDVEVTRWVRDISITQHQTRCWSPVTYRVGDVIESSWCQIDMLSLPYFKSSSSNDVLCVLLCFIEPIFGNRYVRSQGFIVSKPRETHPRSEIADCHV